MSALTARILMARGHLERAQELAKLQIQPDFAEALIGTIDTTLDALDAITARLEQHLVGGAADHPELDASIRRVR